MGKVAVVGIDKFHYAIATNVEGVITYEDPVAIPELQRINIQANATQDKYYADDNVADIIDSFDGATISSDFYGVAFKTISKISGNTIDEHGVVIENSLDEAPYIAIGFRSLKRNGKYRYVWLPYAKKTTHSEEYETVKEKQEPKSMVLPFEAIPVPGTRDWKLTLDEEDLVPGITDIETQWFAKVYDGTLTTT